MIPAGYDPCLMNYATTYFNLPNVQHALHANVTRIPRPWSGDFFFRVIISRKIKKNETYLLNDRLSCLQNK